MRDKVPCNTKELADYLTEAGRTTKLGAARPQRLMWKIPEVLANLPPDLQTPAIKNFIVAVQKIAARTDLIPRHVEVVMNFALKGVERDLLKERTAASLSIALNNPSVLQNRLFGESSGRVSQDAQIKAPSLERMSPGTGPRRASEPDYFRKIEHYLSTLALAPTAKRRALPTSNGITRGIGAPLRLGGIHPPNTLPLVMRRPVEMHSPRI